MTSESVPGLSKARLEALTDGVFAIAMTLMVFYLRVPELPLTAARWELARRILAMWPAFHSYGISFVMLGIYWVGHHILFHYVRRTNRTLLWINLIFLLSVTMIPFSTTLLGRYPGEQAAVIFYGLNLIIVGLLLYSVLRYSSGAAHLMDPDMDPAILRVGEQRILAGPMICLSLIVLAYWRPRWSSALYILVPIAYLLPSRVDRYFRPKAMSARPR